VDLICYNCLVRMSESKEFRLLTEKPTPRIEIGRRISLAGSVQVLLLVVIAQLIVQLKSNFWLDETLTYWTTSAGLSGIVERCTAWPNSILYNTMFYGLRWFGASAPWIFRMPSVAAVALSVVLLFRMVKRLFGVDVAWIAVAAFVSLQPVQFAACDARPYGLGLLMTLVSTHLLLRLMDRPGYRVASSYGVATAIVLYFHLLFIVSLLFHVVYGMYLHRRGAKPKFLHIAVAAGSFAITSSPLVHQYLSAGTAAASHSFADRPHPNLLLEMYFPTFPAAALLVMFITAAVLTTRLRWTWESGTRAYRVFAVFWAITGPVILYALSSISPAQVFIPRYLLPYSGGLAISYALVAGSFERSLVSKAFVWTLAVLLALSLRHPSAIRHTANLGDWGAAIALVNRETSADDAPILMRSQFQESNFVALRPVDDNPAFCQLSYYRTRARVIPLAARFGPEGRATIDNLLDSDGLLAYRFLFVSYNGPPGSPDPFLYYIEGRLGPGWRKRELGSFDAIEVTEFSPGNP
jgi:hypothetical protein